MKKLKVGIVGFGNIGKAIKKQISNDENFELVAVFSKRKIKGCVCVLALNRIWNKWQLECLKILTRLTALTTTTKSKTI